MNPLACPQCEEEAIMIGRTVKWFEFYTYKADVDDGIVYSIKIEEEVDSNCEGASDEAYFFCSQYHRWRVPENIGIN